MLGGFRTFVGWEIGPDLLVEWITRILVGFCRFWLKLSWVVVTENEGGVRGENIPDGWNVTFPELVE